MLIKKIVKKDGTEEPFDIEKVVIAIKKSAERVLHHFTDEELLKICSLVKKECETKCLMENRDNITVFEIHCIVEGALEEVNPKVAKSYRDYRNYKIELVEMMDKVFRQSQQIYYIGDKENSNTDSALVSTKRCLVFNYLNKELYQKFFLNKEEIQACRDGYIYIHDMSARRDTMNCCLFDIENVLKGGFEMGNVWYNEPNSLDTAFDVIGDVTLSAASQQYGGFTLPNIETILKPYAEKTYNKCYEKEFIKTKENLKSIGIEYDNLSQENKDKIHLNLDKTAYEQVAREMEQGFQGWEYKFNTVASSRGDYPFITISAGIGKSKFEKLATITMFNVRKKGQGKKGHKKPVLFPKLVFLYDENLHGEGKELEDVFNAGIECSSKTMYPDWLSLSGDGYVPSIYKKYGKVISPMGCVDGKEVITYKYNNKLYVESFKRLWNRLSEEQSPIGQLSKNDKNLFIRTNNLFIYDTKKQSFVKVNKLIRNVQSNWAKVTISNGRFLDCTEDHPFHTINRGRVLTNQLNIGDEILISNNQYSNESINKDILEAWFYGFMLCDGCYQNYNVFASISEFNENDIEFKFKEAVKNIFGYDVKTIIQHRKSKGNYKDLRILSNKKGNLNYLINLFTKFYGGVNKQNRQIPNEVFSWNKEARLSFLAGMIDADGYIHKKVKKQHCTIQIVSTNKELALQQMLLFQTLNMYAKIFINHYDTKNKEKIRYYIEAKPSQELLQYIVCSKKIKNADNNYLIEKNINSSKITKIELYKQEKYSYDVQTESDHFEVSGIYSHNCRAFLSPWYEKGGIEPLDENDIPIFVGRFNIGAISLHLPMILAKSKKENKDFYEVLNYYMEMIRVIHIRTYNYLGEMKASINPLGFCEGGFLGGNLNFHDKIKPILKSSTASFGITALNELQRLYNGFSIYEDGKFALEVMNYINNKIQDFKKEDNILYAIYATPAESLCGTQIKQFRKKYGIVKNVSDREYVSNSFHCHVSEKITPIQKQDSESRFWDLFNGGKIQYCKYPISYNKEAIKTLVRRAMKLGLYEGVNLSLSYCDDCGHEELNMEVCPICGSKNLTKIDRMNGYLSYSRVKGDTRLNNAKMAEIKDRESM